MVSAGKFRLSLAAMLACAGIGTAQAIPIVDTGTPTMVGPFDSGIGVIGRTNPVIEYQYVAGRFTTTDDYYVTGLSAFVRNFVSGVEVTSTFSLGIATGPAAPVDATFDYLVDAPTSITGDFTAPAWANASLDNYLLAAGSYWIVAFVKPEQFAVGLGMPGGAPNPLEEYAWLGSWRDGWNQLDPWTPSGLGFRVEGTAVPEPATWALMLVGFLGVLTLARRRRA